MQVVDSPYLVPELCRLLNMRESELVGCVAPHVIGWLCVNQRLQELQCLAGMARCTRAGELFTRYAEFAITHILWNPSGAFEALLDFVDSLAPDGATLHACRHVLSHV